MKELVFLKSNQALTTSLKVAEIVEDAKSTYDHRMETEFQLGANDISYMARCLNDILHAFFQGSQSHEDVSTASFATVCALNDITHYMTTSEISNLHLLASTARTCILTNFFAPSSKSTSSDKSCVYILKMSNGSVKIGISSAFQQRISAIMSSSGMEVLNWCHTDYIKCAAAHKIESACHAHFAEQRLKGEFFKISYEEACAELEKHAPITNQRLLP